jgi:hypothetical protein
MGMEGMGHRHFTNCARKREWLLDGAFYSGNDRSSVGLFVCSNTGLRAQPSRLVRIAFEGGGLLAAVSISAVLQFVESRIFGLERLFPAHRSCSNTCDEDDVHEFR